MGEEKQNNIITGEGKRNNIITDEGKRNVIIMDEGEQNNIITDQEERNNGERNNMIIDEKEFNIIEELNNNITDGGERNNMIIDEVELVTKEELNSNIKDEGEINVQTDNVKPTEKVNDNKTNEETKEKLNISINKEEIKERIDQEVDNIKTKEKDKKESLETMLSDTKSGKDEVTKSNNMESISSTTQPKVNDNNPSKSNNERIINPYTPNMSRIPVVSEGLKELRSTSYIPRTPVSFIPQQYISTMPNRNVINEVTPPTFITPTAFVAPNRIAFTVEDYLKSFTETQHMKLTQKTNQKIETLLELKKKAKELITSIPIIQYNNRN
ncbi:hypothetical protein C1645_764465 [Glomus cerebriforme]|uniref:Uncharacterized protein n=1 Tax=Glomus cerebriforme TaxID=658196 RepID=A0A397T6T8_9GLOM|nr:hypothetical protein C1645_764465 [Glomus cerebriforme]